MRNTRIDFYIKYFFVLLLLLYGFQLCAVDAKWWDFLDRPEIIIIIAIFLIEK